MSRLTFGVSGRFLCHGLELENPTAATTFVGYTRVSVGPSERKAYSNNSKVVALPSR